MRKLEGKPEYHVLIADDEPEIRSLLREKLQEDVCQKLPGTYVIYEAEDGQKATEEAGACKASGHSLDLAIVDLRMPGKNGFETLEDLLKTFPDIHVLVFSASTGFYLERLEGYGSRVTPMDKLIGLTKFVDVVTPILSGGNSYA